MRFSKFPDLPSSEEYLDNLGPGPYSKQVYMDRISEGLRRMTARTWKVYLRREKPNKGGLYIEPTDDRKVKNLMSKADWKVLNDYFGAFSWPARRWYVFPDEIEYVLVALHKLGAYPSDPRKPK